ncbi:MAG TPA: LD-carboxypeptidase [Tenuifilaceae bacterium]|jgi:muramoyltetrapeptide carboxypeptidase|nr:LD-carboxypeptidase [Bacteroidota bacterium]MZP81646.1 LD-carboxypeptidase [Bacteroidales bacterium]NLH55809.1 LD-carboxypeptidase [Rikenellaceae bacterium]OQC62922.1 MAG: putative murein peptide carboxypeptidase [Bacteroidetes bacterium ADurb.Bin008]HNV82348.1 LD-carboxypeptidase [Tenuifilaceae bacterium]
MEFISPPFLKKGDTVGIVAPARKVVPEQIEPAIRLIKSWGLNVITGKNLYNQYHQFSGTDVQRASDLNEMISNPEVSAILCARGGYGTLRLLDLINLREVQLNPKWIVGFSDITVLHGMLNSWFMVETIHGAMPFTFPPDGNDNESTTSMKKVLFGEAPTYAIPPHPLNRQGKAQGRLIGGNLSIIHSICRTNADITTDGKILFIEDLDEYLYHIDRMIMSLKMGRKLKNLAGLVVGSMNDMHDNEVPFGKNAQEIILDAVKEYGYPVCFDFPAGHGDRNLALIMGREVTLQVNEQGSTLSFKSSKLVSK